tara:strand:- start:771 stop:1079 length:309 start_codon:yes stop_codon:yes gene_type:complete
MSASTLPSKSQDRSFLIFLLSALSIAFVFGYIDEGYYDLRWMKSIGNWIALGVYALMMLIGQLVFFHVVLSRYSGKGKMALSVVFGCIIGTGSLIGLFYAIH